MNRLTYQHRMAPEILQVVNDRYYDGRLKCGKFAPQHGKVTILNIDGTEIEKGTSYCNNDEVLAISDFLSSKEDLSDTVIITPYSQQVTSILALKLGVPVYTIDSFQGREASTVVVSAVRSTAHGFWTETARKIVALTRARDHLVIVQSMPILLDN